jgi:DNA topoisomerase-1
MDWEVDARRRSASTPSPRPYQGRQALSRHRPGSRGRGDLLARPRRAGRKKALQGVDVKRVTFNAITKQSVLDAVAHPRELDQPLIDAYLARRALDYLVGFTLSPVLWRKLPGSRSAGRVQSVALRLICEREAEIEVFKSREYWTVDALFGTAKRQTLKARLTHLDGRKLDKFDLDTPERAEQAKREIERRAFAVLVDRPPPGAAQPAAALHHLDPAAGSLAQARARRRHRHAHRPAAVRGRRHRRRDGRPDHLHAHRRRAARARGESARPAA